MIKVLWELNEQECESLNEAMALSKHLKDHNQITARIVSDGMEIVGAMGSDGVKDGKLPDSTDYLWVKRRSADGKTQYVKRSRK